MKIKNITYNQYLVNQEPMVVAIGNFDGIHSAHLELIKKAREIAIDKKIKLGVISFSTTPRRVINEIRNYFILKTSAQKKKILENLGVDELYIIQFDQDMKRLPAQKFIDDVLVPLNIKYLVCGFDFTFGANKSGDVNLLKQQTLFETIVIPCQSYHGKKVGSTYIHELIMNGEIEEANKFLTYPYSIIGIVVKGNQKGREIGFPTANLAPIANYRIPENGVYATKIKINDRLYWSMTNIGHNPTFNYSSFSSIETNVFGFNENIYGQEVELYFYKKIRKEKIFDSISDLMIQLRKDQHTVIKYFKDLDHGKI